MAIFTYIPETLQPKASELLADINSYTLSAKSMLTALGDYWTNYYRNSEPLSTAMTGFVAASSKIWTHFLDLVRASNILDVPISQTEQFTLLVIDSKDFIPEYNADGQIESYFVKCAKLRDTTYFTSSLFEAPVVLEKDKHFEIVIDEGYRFYVDLFGDSNISGYSYTLGEKSDQKILLWACDRALCSTIIYNRYGRFLYNKAYDGEKYKWFVSALMFFYENTKSVKAIERVLNVLYGVPYTRYKDETITDIYYVDEKLQPVTAFTEYPFICIQTNKAKYYTYAFSDIFVEVGQNVPQYTVLAGFHKVDDYITKPNWWKDVDYPANLIVSDGAISEEDAHELIDKVLKYNLVHITFGVSFETYQTYMQQVKYFYDIIKDGFPVYLYVMINSIFRARFIELVDLKEEFEKLRLALDTKSIYDWRMAGKYDGTFRFYSEPDLNHGKDAICKQVLYDGSTTFNYPDQRHDKKCENILKYDADTEYSAGFVHTHNKDTETLRIVKLAIKQEDHYTWDTIAPSDITRKLCYNGGVNHDNNFIYSGSHVVGTDGIEMTIMTSLEDTMPDIQDDTKIMTQFTFMDKVGGESYSGNVYYSGITKHKSVVATDNLILKVVSKTGIVVEDTQI